MLLLEQADQIGGRVRTSVTDDGFRIDRGFQVLFSSYPALRRHVPLASLQPQYFGAGVEIIARGHAVVLGHPIFDPTSVVPAIRSRTVTWPDFCALAITASSSLRLGDRSLQPSGISTLQYLEEAGATRLFIERVAAPLFGGISLDRTLSSDSAFWRFVVRSMALGRVFLPAYGIGQLTQSLASRLPVSAVRLNTKVTELLRDGNRVVGVIADGEKVRGSAVVVATEAPIAQKLTGLSLPRGQRSCTTAYFASNSALTNSKRLILNAEPSLVSHAVQLTNVSRYYAPPGQHLLSATTMAVLPEDESIAAAAMLDDLKGWFPRADQAHLSAVTLVRVPYAQFEQTPGIYDRLPDAHTSVDGLYLAGEFLHSSSVQGAMRGGEMAAAAVLESSG